VALPLDGATPGSAGRVWSPGAAQFASLSLEEIAERARLRTIQVVAWRDYTDPEAGGSELHAHRILSAWSRAGIEVVMTTSSVQDGPSFMAREGYQITRRVGRYSIFPRTMISGFLGHLGRADGLVEIWNGMPFLSPIWARCPRVVFLHHVHGEMWKMVLPRGLAELGNAFEHRIAPLAYRHSRIITLSSSSRDEIVEQLGIPAANISISPPGVFRRTNTSVAFSFPACVSAPPTISAVMGCTIPSTFTATILGAAHNACAASASANVKPARIRTINLNIHLPDGLVRNGYAAQLRRENGERDLCRSSGGKSTFLIQSIETFDANVTLDRVK